MKRLDPESPAALDLARGRYVIRQANSDDLAKVHIPWMREAGWNPGLHDSETFTCADPHGFLLGELEGRPIACVSGVRYDDSFGFLGCYIVQESYRGQGYGLAIHEVARTHLEGCTQGGDGVLANVEKYKQIGRVYAYRNARYQGSKGKSDWPTDAAVVDAREIPLSALEELDRCCFPAPRSSFLEAWIHQPNAHALAIPEPDRGRTLRGYGVIRQCFTGWKIGPLFARHLKVAEGIFRGLIAHISVGDSFILDVPEPNTIAMDLVRRYGMSEVFATARMYTGPFPQVNLEWVYGVTTFELG